MLYPSKHYFCYWHVLTAESALCQRTKHDPKTLDCLRLCHKTIHASQHILACQPLWAFALFVSGKDTNEDLIWEHVSKTLEDIPSSWLRRRTNFFGPRPTDFPTSLMFLSVLALTLQPEWLSVMPLELKFCTVPCSLNFLTQSKILLFDGAFPHRNSPKICLHDRVWFVGKIGLRTKCLFLGRPGHVGEYYDPNFSCTESTSYPEKKKRLESNLWISVKNIWVLFFFFQVGGHPVWTNLLF